MANDFHQFNWVQLSSRQRMSPFPNYLSMESVCNEMETNVGFAYRRAIIIYKNNLQIAFFDKKDQEQMSEEVYAWLKAGSDNFRKIIAEINIVAEPFIKKLSNLTDFEVKKLSNKELVELFSFYEKNYKSIYSRYFTVLACEGKFTEKSKKLIGKYEPDLEKANEYFTILTTEPEAMVNQREVIDRIEVIENILSNPRLRQLIRRTEGEILADKELSAMIFVHLDNFFWITRDYEDPAISFEEMVSRIKSGIEDLDRLKAKKTEADNHPSKIAKIEAMMKLSGEEKALFKAIREGIKLKERRKEIVSKSLYHFDKVLLEVCRRADLPLPLVRFAKTAEIKDILSARSGSWREKLMDRYSLSVWLVESGQETEINIGAEADKWYKKLVDIDLSGITELKGQPLSRGKVQGPVKIMFNPDDESKIQQGDVLVTIQAVPSFSSAISRAAAMLADGGTGLTSHTATLAREAKIPAVGQLKIACRVLKDGDMVEVDGDNGIVRIIK